MQKTLLFIAILCCTHLWCRAQTAQPPEVRWETPAIDDVVLTQPRLSIKACIVSDAELSDVSLYINNYLYETRGLKPVRTNCAQYVEANIDLPQQNGYYLLRISASNKDGTTIASRVVELKLPVLSPDDPQNWVQNARYYALIIGVSEYEHRSLNDLEQPVIDAQSLSDVLTQNYNFDSKHVQLLKNPTREKIIESLDNLAQKLTANDNLLIYYAGHGYWDEGYQQGYWLPADAQQDSRTKWIPNTDIQSAMRGIKSKHTLLIADACFGGTLFATREAFSSAPRAINTLYQKPSRNAITSGFEVVPDKSVFARFLLKNLSENPDEFRNAEALFAEMKIAVMNNSLTKQIPKYGAIANTGDEGGDFIFVKKKPATTTANNNVLPGLKPQSTRPTPINSVATAKKDLPNLPEVVFVQGGTFTMGDTFGVGEENEKPTHSVTLSDYFIGKYEVTLAQFKLFVESTGYKTDAEKDGYSWKYKDKWKKWKGINWRHDALGKLQPDDWHPVIHVSWNDAVAYCTWASELSGKRYSLPTEAQWEYAARGRGQEVCFGNGKNSLDPKEANFDGRPDYKEDYSVVGEYRGKTLPVGSFAGNSLGLYDMAGNVWEWCRDWYAVVYYYNSPKWENGTFAKYRVLRGGSWRSYPTYCRAANRLYTPSNCYYDGGFRVVLAP